MFGKEKDGRRDLSEIVNHVKDDGFKALNVELMENKPQALLVTRKRSLPNNCTEINLHIAVTLIAGLKCDEMAHLFENGVSLVS